MSASSLGRLLARFGEEVGDPDDETFLLFAHERPSAQNLGFVDAHAAALDLVVAGRDLTIHQSPAVLTSNRSGGTTGAVLWKISPVVAEWLARADNVFFREGLLTPASAVLELGCGIAGVIGLVLTGKGSKTAPAPKKKKRGTARTAAVPAAANTVGQYVLTDQPYVAKFLQRNLDENGAAGADERLSFCSLDWEEDAVMPGPRNRLGASSFDAVLACDCIYNEALVAPLVQTCVDVCRLRAAAEDEQDKKTPTLCIVAQQLREPDVLTAWLAAFAASFRAWRVPEELLIPELQPSAGFVVHVGVLKEADI